MIQSHLGEIYALITAVFWTITAVCFELAGKKIGSFGLIFSKIGMGNYDPFAATQIRIISGIIGLKCLLRK